MHLDDEADVSSRTSGRVLQQHVHPARLHLRIRPDLFHIEDLTCRHTRFFQYLQPVAGRPRSERRFQFALKSVKLSHARRVVSESRIGDQLGASDRMTQPLPIGLVGRATADENACQTALGKTVLLKPATAAASSPAVGKKKEGGFGGFLKGLGKRLDQTLGTKK